MPEAHRSVIPIIGGRDPRQWAKLRGIMRKNSGLFVVVSLSLGLASFGASLEGQGWASEDASILAPLADTLQKLTDDFDLTQVEAMSGSLLDGPEHSLAPDEQVFHPAIRSYKYQHFYKGKLVLGSMVIHHLGRRGHYVQNELSHFNMDVTPGLSDSDAASAAQSFFHGIPVARAPRLMILADKENNAARLVYMVKLKGRLLHGRHVILDARNGALVADLPDEIDIQDGPTRMINPRGRPRGAGAPIVPPFFAQGGAPAGGGMPIEVFNASGGKIVEVDMNQVIASRGKLPPEARTACEILENVQHSPMMFVPQNCPQVVKDGAPAAGADASAQRAASNSALVLQYYSQNFNRNSYDGKGSPLVSMVHAGQKWDNAFWSQGQNVMAYGDGDGVQFRDFTNGVDVAGHEMTHGVTSETAKLLMAKDAGALNEANSDFFGVMIANGGTNWVIGQGLSINPAHPVGIRDLAKPSNLTFAKEKGNPNAARFPYPEHISQRVSAAPGEACDGHNDFCWVHINATITGHARFLVTQAIGKKNAEQLYYVVLTQYLTPTSTIPSEAQNAMSACDQLFDAQTCGNVKGAYAQVGL